MFSAVQSSSAARRLTAARAFVDALPRHSEILILSASRGAADDFARDVARTRGATFGLYRFSLTQLAARLAAPLLARERLTATTALGVQAVSARALFEAAHAGELAYFRPVWAMPGFPRALARTLEELALGGVSAAAVAGTSDGGPDLSRLLMRFDEQFEAASAVDRARFLATAAAAIAEPDAPYGGCHVLLLDLPIVNAAERRFVEALGARAPQALATIAVGDEPTRAALARLGAVSVLDSPDGEPSETGSLDRVRRHLFSAGSPPPADPLDCVELFSAPGEGREAVEIARRVLREARGGVPFDRIAIAVRAPQQYGGLLEHALSRAGIPAYFDRGTRRPHPAGRAFLAILACASDGLSAARFAEYLSLGQVPQEPHSSRSADGPFPAASDEVFGVLARGEGREGQEGQEGQEGREGREGQEERPVRSPWKWERLLAESRVVASEDRWARRLKGLVAECELQRRELQRTEPDSPRITHLARKIADLQALSAFALPIVRTLATWPARANWGEWLERFEALAPRVLRRPDHVLRVLVDLRPMAAIGPIELDEAAQVLAERLGTIEADAPARRYGRVLVATPAALRGRLFDVVFVPALAERIFPQKPREDPLLLDDARRSLGSSLPTAPDRSELEKLQLRLAIGAAAERIYISFPTVEIGEGRPRVPSLYALEVWRAMTGRVPGGDELQHAAARASQATLAWPAPTRPDDAIDALEHDLSTLRRLVSEPDDRARGRAQYILQLNDCLQRSVRERYLRGKPAWSHRDGLTRVSERTAPLLAAYRLSVRPYSLSALQKYATCPYQFLLSAIFRLRPADDLEPLQRMDPLTRGSLFHAAQTAFYRRLKDEGALPVVASSRDRALTTLDASLRDVASEYHELLAPAVERIWNDEIATIRRDLRLWVDEIVAAGPEWVPMWFEWSFGLKHRVGEAERDPDSCPEPVAIDGRFLLHGSIDLVEERAGSGELRVTDHKTGKYRGKEQMVVGGGSVLQPVLYGLALEAALGRTVAEGRLYYATMDGGYRDVRIPLNADARRLGVEVLEIIDRGIEGGFLAAAPDERACGWCDFRPVCGPGAQSRAARKSPTLVADLLELRRKR
jgi:CRISPR/Cas system-associated exonuclease Cas4 (RecB family)